MFSQGTWSRNNKNREHPVEHEWYEGRDHETGINHTVGREGKPAVPNILGDGFVLRLLRGRHRTT